MIEENIPLSFYLTKKTLAKFLLLAYNKYIQVMTDYWHVPSYIKNKGDFSKRNK